MIQYVSGFNFVQLILVSNSGLSYKLRFFLKVQCLILLRSMFLNVESHCISGGGGDGGGILYQPSEFLYPHGFNPRSVLYFLFT